mmetsp:Transcript_29741/g.30163  ORF Transcript_29741/g.30163 Transcript_29741/m.30163 type:complete len:86 (-) Transcript_29741:316-573(-)
MIIDNHANEGKSFNLFAAAATSIFDQFFTVICVSSNYSTVFEKKMDVRLSIFVSEELHRDKRDAERRGPRTEKGLFLGKELQKSI